MFEIHHMWIRLLGTSVFVAALAFFIGPMFVGVRNAGSYAGIFLCVLGILYFAANPTAAAAMRWLWDNSVGHVVMCILLGALGIAVIIAVVLSFLMVHAQHRQPDAENPVVILGCKVKDGAPSLMLRRRLDAALIYLDSHPDVPVIVCGGQGADESMSEAQCMADYLTAHGVADARIYKDDTSASTEENLRNAKAILDAQEWDPEITIVTDGYHQLRASMTADSLGMQTAAVSAETSWYLVPVYWVREWLAICWQFVFG